ncbi:GNAT family N-acetyltransferase [Lederbergia lenta]|uniref:Acetyltransferase (GNAT) family n=1 Tax=Lederbergia lenta TaxID=1467 RepID=A0A2X4W2B6_LEDLE|nr:GNAT family N-acetyltransferase [Lederbergia lenta]MCM3112386.1 GNAT family N-acetyltransferase [Lederbergia lenta]MEC2326605.1 GNAT family N-acetyltransferase [Lederbergia lenta]SQI53052.1 Acetyltransferase (GNAT) family [Lederbergia lenta]
MKRIPLKMIRKDLLNIPQYSLPTGFRIRLFEKGDEHNWARIETKVDEFENEKAALERFNKEFGAYIDEMSIRCLFIENEHGEAIATTTAWYGDLNGDGEISGRIHWVGVVPEYQGKKLSKPLLSAAMNILAQHHSKAYLTSQTTSYQAINMYLNYGFEPFITGPSCYEAWELIEKTLNRQILSGR